MGGDGGRSDRPCCQGEELPRLDPRDLAILDEQGEDVASLEVAALAVAGVRIGAGRRGVDLDAVIDKVDDPVDGNARPRIDPAVID